MEPLASKIRPKSLEEFVGQEHLVGKDKPLRIAIEQKHIMPFILWGPPGVGKTTLARIYANALGADFFELSAVSAGKDDIRQIVGKPSKQKQLGFKAKVLFLDEIHRFNKAQQDYLLPFVESGELILVGATTENPSFEVIPALLSRCRVFVLNEFSDEEMHTIIKSALHNLIRPSGTFSSTGEGNNPSLNPSPSQGREIITNPSPEEERGRGEVNQEAIDWLISMANGDARQAIAMIENTSKLYDKITIDTLKETLQSKHLRYDKKGEEHYNTISAFIKSMRASQTDAALYYLGRMIDSGEDPKFIARRMVIFASEDIGLAQPTALVVANAVFQACETIGLPECQINLAHGVAYLCQSKKDRSSYEAYFAALADVKEHGNLPIPMNIRNAPTKLMKELGYGKGYEKYDEESYLPEKLKNKKYLKKKPAEPE